MFYRHDGNQTTEFLNEFLAYRSFVDLLPYRFYDDKLGLFVNNNSIGLLWSLPPLVGTVEHLHPTLTSFFQNNLPKGCALQATLIASPFTQSTVEHWALSRKNLAFQNLAIKRQNFFNGLFTRSFDTFISLSAPLHFYKNAKLKETFCSAGQALSSALHACGAPSTPGTPLTLFYILHHQAFFAPTAPKLQWDQRTPLNQQAFRSPCLIKVNEDHLSFQHKSTEQHSTFYTTNGFPDQWSPESMSLLLGCQQHANLQISTPFFISYGAFAPDEKTLKSRLMTKCAQIEKQAHSPLAKWIPSLAKEVEEWRFVRQKFHEGQKVIKTRMQVCLWGCPTKVAANHEPLLALFQRHGFSLQPNRYTMLPSLLSALPMSWGNGMALDNKRFGNLKTTLSQEPPCLMPLQGDWKGTRSPHMLLLSRRSQVLFWDPFDNDTGNYNVCVIGRSGSGKSVFMQELAFNNLGKGGAVFIIDVGRSFEKMAQLFGAQYIQFSIDNPFSINPFAGLTKDCEALISLTKPILSSMASPSGNLTDIESALLDKAIFLTWKKLHERTTVTEVASTLKSLGTTTSHNLAEKLFSYTIDGIYGKFFHKGNDLNKDNPFVVIEMEELKERRDLQSVLIQIIIITITSQLYAGDRSTHTHIILDEAWDLLQGGSAAFFIETAARRLRKYKGSLVIGTQSAHDLFQSPSARAAFENSDWLCLLSQKVESVNSLRKEDKITLPDSAIHAVHTLKTEQGKFAEIMICGPHGQAITRLLLDPFSQMLYTSTPQEFAFIANLQKQGVALDQAILQAVSHFKK